MPKFKVNMAHEAAGQRNLFFHSRNSVNAVKRSGTVSCNCSVSVVWMAGLSARKNGLTALSCSIVVGKVGTVPIARHELVAALTPSSGLSAGEKLLDRERLATRVAEWRAAGQTIVFTNGCFDILHPGHLKVLEAARSRCDRLLVGLNSDESIKRLKGLSRPIQSEPARALVLASLNCVDGVVVFGNASDDDTPRKLILALRPDIVIGIPYEAPHLADVARGGVRRSWNPHRWAMSWRRTMPTVRWNIFRSIQNSPSRGIRGRPAGNQSGTWNGLPSRDRNS